MFLDEAASLKALAFPLDEATLISKAKEYLFNNQGVDAPGMLADDFSFMGPFVGGEGGLTKEAYLSAVGGFNIKLAFPDLDPRFHAFRADPLDAGRSARSLCSHILSLHPVFTKSQSPQTSSASSRFTPSLVCEPSIGHRQWRGLSGQQAHWQNLLDAAAGMQHQVQRRGQGHQVYDWPRACAAAETSHVKRAKRLFRAPPAKRKTLTQSPCPLLTRSRSPEPLLTLSLPSPQVMERSMGNTGGLGGVFGPAYAIGKPLPFPEANPWKPSKRYQALMLVGRLATWLKNKK